MSDPTPHDPSSADSADGELAQELVAMLARRADSHEAGPDLARVMADAGRSPAPAGGLGSRAYYLLGIAAVILVLAGIGLLTMQGGTQEVKPLDGGAPCDADADPDCAGTPVPTATTTTWLEHTQTTLGCQGPGPTNPNCGGDPGAFVPTTLGCDAGPGPTNPDCDGTVFDPQEVEIDPDCPANGTPCCKTISTSICHFHDPDDPPPDATVGELVTTPSFDPNDCLQITTVPDCASTTSAETTSELTTTTT